jgi:hydrogenase maturation protease
MSGGRFLVYGYGNPGRQDDGLGPMLAEEIAKLGLPFVETDANYQLQIEDAAEIADFDLIVFADAAVEGVEPFSAKRLAPALNVSFTTHSVPPESVLAICRDHFGKSPDAVLIGVRGYEFDIREGLTANALLNLKHACEYVILLLEEMKGKIMDKTERKTILIIDDDSDLRAAMRIVLEASGFTVGEAASGDEGFKIADRIQPDAVIVDLMMETVDAGSKVSTKLKESGYKGPIFLLSAAGDTVRYNIDARELGLAGIFQKPIDHKLLVTTLKKQLKMA